jgi:sulfatase maturation enzyme AslB (radical SAM superfamily)
MILKRTIKTILAKCGYKLIRIGNPEPKNDAYYCSEQVPDKGASGNPEPEPEPENDAYYCRALTGMSGYNISINSDLSISCSCQDYGGEGKFGDLSSANTLRSVFLSEKANTMRTELANGKLPIGICSYCPELCKAPKYIAEYYSKHIKMPTNGIMLENCSICNYDCRYCSRKEISASHSSSIISVDNMKYIANEIKENKIKSIYFFKLGEPFLDKDIYKKIQILREINPGIEIVTSTNGLLIDNPEKVEAALIFDRIYFSIDGISTEMQNKYQRGADFEKTMDNVKMIINKRGSSTKPVLGWKYVVFSWNEAVEYINEAFKKAVEIGFDRLLFTEGGTVGNKNDRTKRYYMKDFIPADINYNLIVYGSGYGMEFDLHKKNEI